MRNQAKNDELINSLLASGELKVRPDGAVLSNRSRQGHLSDHYRRLELVAHHGYFIMKRRGKTLALHRIVYAALIGPLDCFKHINHIDGNGLNNRPSNLELVTPSENMRHLYEVIGHLPVAGNAKIDNDTAVAIRAAREAGSTFKALAKRFRVSKTTIADVVNRRTWK